MSTDAEQLSALLDRIDFIGVYDPPENGPPPGEYSCMVEPILQRLHDGVSEARLAEWLGQEIWSHFGLGKGQPDLDMARQIRVWWGNQRVGA